MITLYPYYQVVPSSAVNFKVKLWPEWRVVVFIAQKYAKPGAVATWEAAHVATLLKECDFDLTRYPPTHRAVKLGFGPWGLEHLTVPGASCGLDLEITNEPVDGRVLTPHNVDNFRQAHLLQTIFSWWANSFWQVASMRGAEFIRLL